MGIASALRAAFTCLLLGQWRWRMPAEEARVPAIYIFGDSTVDVGNNNYLKGDNVPKANFPPYGIDYPGGKPTGRFCNGYIGVDFLAMKLGFQESPPPTLSIAMAEDENRGVNYASGGSGVLDATGQNFSLSMNQQIGYFKKSVGRLIRVKGTYAAKSFLAKSIFVVSTANNDIFRYYSTSGARNTTQNEQFVNLLAGHFVMQLEEIYGLGARKFAVYGTGLSGCAPSWRIFSPSYECNEDINELSNMFNKAMESKFRCLSSKWRGMKYSYIHSRATVTPTLKNHIKHEFNDTEDPCCGGTSMGTCDSSSSLCANREEYLWWDAVHPTQAFHWSTATAAYSGFQRIAVPINLRKLVYS